tara:strand:- start:1636 stop:1902 length:267 start_codon:yes stop_codon:yes gene_type:complete
MSKKFITKNTNVWAKLQDPAALVRAPDTVKPEDLHRSNSLAFMNPREKQKTSKHIHTSKQQAGPTHNQQASRGSSTVDHGPGTPDPQA